jgi:carboxyl-terminal processing protease
MNHKYISYLKIALPFFILWLLIPDISGQNEKSACQKPFILTRTFENNHYKPKALDDSMSQEIFFRFLALTDPEGLIFTTDDIKTLSHYQFMLDDLIKSQSCEFLDDIVRIYRMRLIENDSLISAILGKPLDYDKKDSLVFDMSLSSRQFPGSGEKIQRWQKWLKYQVINRLIISAVADSSSLYWTLLVKKEALARQNVLKKEKAGTDDLIGNLKNDNTFITDLFLNAIATCYDPHSAFFSESGKKTFEESLSKEKRSFGMVLEENLYGQIVVSKLVPGGPAWKSNELHKGDVLLKIKTNDGKMIDFISDDGNNLSEFLKKNAPETILLTVRKPDGRVKTVKLKSEIIENEENKVSSYILKGDKTLGYISLPDFYTDFSQGNGLGCANDVAKEILNLKKEQMQGLILDLRDNGGGSIEEAIELAGIFINEGPLIFVKNNLGRTHILKDVNRGTVYNGPLIILVNQSTASASEIVVSALHEYNRALIVGSRTFGKATGQLILPMDSSIHLTRSMPESQETKDFVKITVEQIFPLSGISYQKKGIQPDIVLGGEENPTDESESDYSSAINPETVQNKIQYVPNTPLPVSQLIENFEKIEKARTQKMQSKQEEQIVSKDHQFIKLIVDPEILIHFYKNIADITDQSTDSTLSNFVVNNTRSDAFILKMNEESKMNDDRIKFEIKKDQELQDAYLIMDQLINLCK